MLDWWNDRREISEDGFDKAQKFTAQQLTEELLGQIQEEKQRLIAEK